MTNPYLNNPFEILRLDPASSPEEIVAQAARLCRRAVDAEELTTFRQAVQTLAGRPEDRLGASFFTHPRPCYHGPDLDRWAAAFRRPPELANLLNLASPSELAELAEIVRWLLGDQAVATSLSGRGMAQSRIPGESLREQLEALWLALGQTLGAFKGE